MSNINDARVAIAAKLTAGGVVTSTDPKVTVPAVLVGSPTVLGTEGVGGWRVEFPIQIMSTPPGNEASLKWMLDQLESALVVFPGSAFPRTIDHGGADVPAYVLTVTQSVTNPNC
jgi:hypothetical protein